jgi:plasmid stabilization system protein ParE
MSEFKREERYTVIKHKRIDSDTMEALRELIDSYQIPTEECVVVEHDWPNYEHVWQTVKQVADGTFDADLVKKQAAEIERLQAEIERLRADFADARSCAKALEQEMNRARADEHQAMHYLEQIRKAVAPDVDFPTLVRMCGEIQQERDQLKAVIAQCHEAMCAVSQAAYDNAFPVCCGYAGAECCGLPDPDWSEHDKLIMDTLDGPINAVANQLRAKASEA